MGEIKTAFRIVMVLVVMLLMSAVAAPAGGNLDPDFGEQGLVVTDFGIDDDEALALAVQPDGKIILAGFSTNSVSKDVAVARYLPDGQLDTTFDDDGFTTFSVGSGNAMAQAIAVQEDGRIVIAGTADNGVNSASTAIFVIRLTVDGAPDTTFAAGGRLILPLGDKSGTAHDLQITLDGDILVAGTAGGSNGLQAMIARVDQQGKMDATFGSDGIVIIDREYETAAHSLAVQSDNSILLAGYSKPEGLAGLSLFRLKADGSIDDAFGTTGEVRITDGTGEAIIYDMAAQADGRLVVVGTYHNGEYREVLLGRFLATGQVDTSFGTAGTVRSDLGYDSVGSSVAVQNDGAILVTGYTQTAKGKDIILLRYGAETTATEEATAATTGAATATAAAAAPPAAPATTDSVASFSNAAVTAQAETAGATGATAGTGGVATTAAGTATTGSAADSAIASYIADSVSLYDDAGQALVALPDGRVLAAGYSSNGDDNDFVLLQYSAAAMSALADSTTGTADGVSSTYYQIATTPVTNITRNGAMSGGSIVKIVSGADGTIPTVTARGVCYGTARHPVYRVPETTTTSSTTDSTSTSILPPTVKDTSFNYKTVLYGQTSDGSGVGAFGSNIVNITPDTVYYVRAYAVLSDDTVIYGNEYSFETNDACFIATAAYGSVLDAHVVVLRNFRDRYLRGNALGQALIERYYRYSPMIAEVIEHNDILKRVVRVCLWPWVAFSYLMLEFAVWVKFVLLLLVALIGGAAVHSLRSNVLSRNRS